MGSGAQARKRFRLLNLWLTLTFSFFILKKEVYTLFKKAAVFTDIHFGLKSNSKQHNQDCEEFVDWFIQTAKDRGCETAIFCGDWHHNRNSLNITTMDATLRSLEKLGQE